MTALRHSMRVSKPWETSLNHKTNQEWDARPPENDSSLDEDIQPYISNKDKHYLKNKSNKSTALLFRQSHHLRELKEKGVIWEFSFLELENLIKELFTIQGKSERIKNFPYPRQFATLNHFFMWIFVLLLPLALVLQFGEIGSDVTAQNLIIGKLSFGYLSLFMSLQLGYSTQWSE